ncbi:hypothetical protein ACF08W_29160 [Streptomyces sp. NPDC015144]|uniref:hypothetical protein n=1 Tax=Streptomyces sp. NPDC015144 TaxID=3364944 RepID=UPI003702A642
MKQLPLKAHLYPSADSGTWMIDVIRDLPRLSDDYEEPVEPDDEDGHVATMDTGVPEPRATSESVPQEELERSAIETLRRNYFYARPGWQIGNGELTAVVNPIEPTYLVAWEFWRAYGGRDGETRKLGNSPELHALGALFTQHSVTPEAVHRGALLLLAEIAAFLSDDGEAERILRLWQAFQEVPVVADTATALLAAEPIDAWHETRMALGVNPLVDVIELWRLAFSLSGAFDLMCNAVGTAARFFVGTEDGLLDPFEPAPPM